MQSTVARPAPSAQPTPIYVFIYAFTVAAEALGLPRGWHLDTIPGTSADPCVIVQTEGAPASLRAWLLSRGFAVGTDPASPGLLYVCPPLASLAREATS